MSDIVELLTERRKLRYSGNCKCGKCCLVPHEMLCSAIDEIKRLRATITVPDQAYWTVRAASSLTDAAVSHQEPGAMRSKRSERATSLLPAKEGE